MNHKNTGGAGGGNTGGGGIVKQCCSWLAVIHHQLNFGIKQKNTGRAGGGGDIGGGGNVKQYCLSLAVGRSGPNKPGTVCVYGMKSLRKGTNTT